MDEIQIKDLYGTCEEVVFRNEDSGFTVLDISTEDGELITVVGVLPDIAPGEEVHFLGHWDTHQSFGRQFKAESCERTMPSTAAQMLKYLSGGTVRGIGPSLASKIVEAFGNDTFDVIENYPEKLAKIRGISMDKAESISRQFREQSAVRDIIIKLESIGLTPNECLNVYKVFGKNSVNRVTENPYLLCIPEIGIQFERADGIASGLPNKISDEFRIKAGILHVVTHNLSNGHTCLPREKMLSPCADLLSVDKDTIDILIDTLTTERQLVCTRLDNKEFIFLPQIYDAETKIAGRIKMMVAFPPAGRSALLKEIEKREKRNGIK